MSALCAGYEQADEAACGDMKAAVQAYDAPEEQKEPFLNRLQQRVEEIWSAEDGALFEKLYLATDITDSDAVAKALEEIKQTARTAASERYISALETCTEKEIHKARLFRLGVRPRVYGIIGGTFFLLGVSNLFFLHLGILATILCIVVSIVFAGLYTDLKGDSASPGADLRPALAPKGDSLLCHRTADCRRSHWSVDGQGKQPVPR